MTDDLLAALRASVEHASACDCPAFDQELGWHSKVDHEVNSCGGTWSPTPCGGCWDCMAAQAAYYASKETTS